MLPLGEPDRLALLGHARQALEEGISDQPGLALPSPEGALLEHAGAFVTLRKTGTLRGCIGYVESTRPLYLTVRECAIAAALRDPRFEPVILEELPDIRIEISVLSLLRLAKFEEIEIGKHGLQVTWGFQRGLLLPQVAVEWKWDRTRFLQETCLKAGLPPDAWQHGAMIQVFTAQIFSEPDAPYLPRAAGHRTSVTH